MIKLFVNCFLLLCNSLLSTSKEITEQKSLSIVLYGMKHQLEEIKEYQTKQDIRIHDLEQDKLNRNLEYDMLIRKLEKNNAIREQEQNNRIHELESDNRILKQEQNNRIRKFECDNRILKQKQNNRILKLEHDIRIQNIHIEALNSKYIHSENVKPIVKVNDAMTLYKQNMTTLETTEDNLKLTAKEAIPVNVTKHLNDRRCGKDGIAGRCHRKRLLLKTDTSTTIAFYAYMDTHETNPGRHQTLIFDEEKTNIGSAYNKHSGLFISPGHGIYVFTWTIVSDLHGYIYSEIMINSTPFGSILTNSQEIADDHTVTGIVVAEVNQGDVVYIRTNPNASIRGQILSDTLHRTSFSGWKID